MKRIFQIICSLVFCTTLTAVVHAQPIDTTPGWNGTSFISSFGVPNTATYGQTVTVGERSRSLSGFSFQVQLTSGGPTTMRGLVYAWDDVNQRATGPALFQSAPVVVSNAAFTSYSFTLPSPLSVTPGQKLVLFATTSLDAQTNGVSRWGTLTNDTSYPGGRFVFMNNGTDSSRWTTSNWSYINQDLAFTATFDDIGATPVPTLSSWALAGMALMLGLLGATVMRRRT